MRLWDPFRALRYAFLILFGFLPGPFLHVSTLRKAAWKQLDGLLAATEDLRGVVDDAVQNWVHIAMFWLGLCHVHVLVAAFLSVLFSCWVLCVCLEAREGCFDASASLQRTSEGRSTAVTFWISLLLIFIYLLRSTPSYSPLEWASGLVLLAGWVSGAFSKTW